MGVSGPVMVSKCEWHPQSAIEWSNGCASRKSELFLILVPADGHVLFWKSGVGVRVAHMDMGLTVSSPAGSLVPRTVATEDRVVQKSGRRVSSQRDKHSVGETGISASLTVSSSRLGSESRFHPILHLVSLVALVPRFRSLTSDRSHGPPELLAPTAQPAAQSTLSVQAKS